MSDFDFLYKPKLQLYWPGNALLTRRTSSTTTWCYYIKRTGKYWKLNHIAVFHQHPIFFRGVYFGSYSELYHQKLTVYSIKTILLVKLHFVVAIAPIKICWCPMQNEGGYLNLKNSVFYPKIKIFEKWKDTGGQSYLQIYILGLCTGKCNKMVCWWYSY